METTDTKYGILKNIEYSEYHKSGMLKRCILKQKYTITVSCGTFIPQYEDGGKRKKLTKSITLYENGIISSMVLQNPTNVPTKIGSVPAEMITFYESGAVKRIFPVYGTITGFWTEKDEYAVSPELNLNLPFGGFKGKAINVAFYETGELKSMTLWPKDTIQMKTPAGEMEIRIGFCLYPDGKIKSVEPSKTVNVDTPIGSIPCFDPDALGLDGENNSLVFSEDGTVESLLTSVAQVTVFCCDDKVSVYAPALEKSDYFDDTQAVIPMKISFIHGSVCFGKRKCSQADIEYKIAESSFKIEDFNVENCRNTCEECDC